MLAKMALYLEQIRICFPNVGVSAERKIRGLQFPKILELRKGGNQMEQLDTHQSMKHNMGLTLFKTLI